MSKLPRVPNPEHLGAQTLDIATIAQGTELNRIYWCGGAHPSAWNAMRRFGPTEARFDQHEKNVDGKPHEQERGIYYAATDITTALAEVFQKNRIVDRRRGQPWLATFVTTRDINLLDLTDTFAVRAGGSMKLVSCSTVYSQNWARGFYECYPDIEGIYYDPQFVASQSDACGTASVGAAVLHNPDTRASSMTNRPIVALFERILDDDPFPVAPLLDRALDDDRLFEILQDACDEIGYVLP